VNAFIVLCGGLFFSFSIFFLVPLNIDVLCLPLVDNGSTLHARKALLFCHCEKLKIGSATFNSRQRFFPRPLPAGGISMAFCPLVLKPRLLCDGGCPVQNSRKERQCRVAVIHVSSLRTPVLRVGLAALRRKLVSVNGVRR